VLFLLSANSPYAQRPAGLAVNFNDNALNGAVFFRIGPGALHPVGDLTFGAVNADVGVHADYPVCRACHAKVGDVGGSAGQYPFVGGLYMGMGSGNDVRPAVKVIAQGFFLFG
jgi:hypothetical protein